MERKKIFIIGGGPAGLMAAAVLSPTHNVHIYDKEKNVGQKFLLAGKGGFNLTNSALGEALTRSYSPAGFLNKALLDFDTLALRKWFADMEIPTFVGSSGRVFPEKDIKPIDILNKILAKLKKQGVQFHTAHEFVAFDDSRHVTFSHQGQEVVLEADYVLFALGGASWPVTGSDGSWRTIFESMGVSVIPFQSSNCGLTINWPEAVRMHHAGKPIKNITLVVHGVEMKGEVVITDYGIEGNAVYPLVPVVRELLNTKEEASVDIDFKPLNSEEQLLQKIQGNEVKAKDYGQLFNLNTAQLAIIKAYTDKESYLSAAGFIRSLKKLTIPIESLRPVEEAISTIGGIAVSEVNADFSLKKYPWVYTIGEMLDWDAPTGGFLLQGCFSMGHYAAKSILTKE